MIHAINKTLAEHADKIDPADKAAVEAAVSDAQKAIESNDKDDIRAKTEALSAVSQKIGEKIYAEVQKANAEAEAAAETQDTQAKSGDAAGDVVDAEFTEVDDKDNK